MALKKYQVLVYGAGEDLNNVIAALRRDVEVTAIASDMDELVGTIIGDLIVKPITEIRRAYDIDIIIADYYWKEKARQLFNDFGIKKAKVFQWEDKDKGIYFLKNVNCFPLYYQFESLHFDDNIEKIRTVKRGNRSKHILFLAYYFPPIGGSPIQRTLKYVKYLTQLVYKITVVTVDYATKEHRDDSLLEEVPVDVSIIRFKNTFTENDTLSVQDQHRIYNLLCSIDSSEEFLNLLYETQKEQIWYPLPDRLIMWAAEVYENIDKKIDMSSVDVLYSTVPEWSPHLLGYLFKKKYAIPWVADYRDPWAVNKEYADVVYPIITKNEYQWHRQLEKQLICGMDAMIQIGDYCKRLYEEDEDYQVDPTKIFVIPNGYDEQDFVKIEPRIRKNERFTICYNGSLGYSRKPQFVLKAIDELIQDGVVDKDKICWVFNGPNSEKRFSEDVKNFDEYGIVINNGMLSHADSLKIAMDSDLLVVYGEYGVVGKMAFTGKFMEYLRIGRPILAFSAMDSPISEILKETNLGSNYLLEDIEGIKKCLLYHYQKWEQNDNEMLVFCEKIKEYSREYLSKQLAQVFEKVRKADE